MRYRGKYLNKEQWLSLCSKHYNHDKDCELCNAGNWHNVFKLKISRAFYKLSPKIWIWWMN